MKPYARVAVVIALYAAALALAALAVHLGPRHAQDPAAQVPAGMAAFGESLRFVAVFGTAALLPTGLALRFLRPVGAFWTALAAFALAVAACGALAAVLYAAGATGALRGPRWEMAAALAVPALLATPPLAAAFALAAGLAPAGGARRGLVVAAVIEAFVGGLALFQFWLAALRGR